MRFCLSIVLLASCSTAYAADPAPTRPTSPTNAAFHFENDILPILGRYGCNSSGCHGKAEGQGGFKLSVFASDPEADFAALTKEGRGGRVFPAAKVPGAPLTAGAPSLVLGPRIIVL